MKLHDHLQTSLHFCACRIAIIIFIWLIYYKSQCIQNRSFIFDNYWVTLPKISKTLNPNDSLWKQKQSCTLRQVFAYWAKVECMFGAIFELKEVWISKNLATILAESRIEQFRKPTLYLKVKSITLFFNNCNTFQQIDEHMGNSYGKCEQKTEIEGRFAKLYISATPWEKEILKNLFNSNLFAVGVLLWLYSQLYDEYIDRTKLTEQKKTFQYIVFPSH